MGVENAEEFAANAVTEVQRVRDALDAIDGTDFADLPRLFDQMARDCDDAIKWIDAARAEIQEIEEAKA